MSRSKISFSPAEIFVVAILLVFGTAACIGLPVLSGFDEDQHLSRIWEMSTFHFLPNEMLASGKIPFPAIYIDLSNRAQPYGSKIERSFWSKNAKLPIDAHDYIYGDVSTRSAYSPLLLFPQALVMRYLGRRAGMPALTVFYAMRLIGLLCYILLIWLAVRLAPFGKWIFAVLAVAPMALFEATTINVDTISNGVAFLFIAGCLAIAFSEKVRWREWSLLVLLFFLLFSTKVNFIFLAFLPFLIIPPSRFKMKGGFALLVLAVVILFAVEFIGWTLVNISHTSNPFPNANPLEQLKFLVLHPLEFPKIVILDLWSSLKPYVRQWFGVYGYGYWAVPFATYIFFGLGLVAAVLQPAQDREPTRKIRLYLGLIFILGYLATVAALYLSYTPVGSSEILGVQGRYFIPVVPCLCLALSGLPRIKMPRLLTWPVIAVSMAASLAFFSVGYFFSYYVTCGTMYYQPGLCYRPVYKKWTPSTKTTQFLPPLAGGATLSQKLVPECNGITDIRVWVDASGASGDGKTEFTFQDANNGTILQKEAAADSLLSDGGWYTLNFAPDWASAGKTFQLNIRSQNQSGGMGVKIGYYNATSVSTIGELLLNGQHTEGTVIYQYGCVAGLEKIWRQITHKGAVTK